ncbi:MAG TPA: hypothetical protein VM582_07975, partial [Candidatus Thermoplasmatota archaeon]|nr:hypothetical protein [Candidatus Thermoplasmatota archaeon]
GALTGVFTPQRAGEQTIVASAAGGFAASTLIAVAPGALHELRFAAAPAWTDADTPVRFSAVPLDRQENARDDVVTYALAGSGDIDADGLFTPRLVGDAVVTASAFDASGAPVARTATIRVDAGRVASVAFSGLPESTTADAPVPLAAAAFDQHGNLVPGATPVLSIAAGHGAIVAGAFVPRLVGDVVLRAALGSVAREETLAVTVGALHAVAFTLAPDATDADTPVAFLARALDAHGNVRADPIAYSLAGSGAIDAGSGLFVPALVGTHTVTATAAPGVARSAAIAVAPGAVATVAFDAPDATTDADTPLLLGATAYDRNGNAVPVAVAYALEGSGELSPAGLFTPHAAGTSTITASVGAIEATRSVAVAPGAPASLAFVEAPPVTDADTPVSLRAVVRDAKGNLRADLVTYEVVSGVGSLATDGAFTPTRTGTVVVRATAGSLTREATLVVAAGMPVRIAFSAAPADTDADTPVTFAASALDAQGNVVPVAVGYEVVGSGAIDASGAFTPALAGTTTVVAKLGLIEERADVVVTPGALHEVRFTQEDVSTDADKPVQFAAAGFDRHGNARADPVAYTVLGSGSISASGLFTPGSAGTSTIVATVLDATGAPVTRSTTISVSAGGIARVVFLAPPSSTSADLPVRFTGHALDAQDNVVPDAPLVFSRVSGPGVVAADGTFTPGLVGSTLVRLSSGSTSATTAIVTTPGALRTLTLAPAHAPVAGSPLTLDIVGRDANGNDVGYMPRSVVLDLPTRAGPASLAYEDPATGIKALVAVTVAPGAATRLALEAPANPVAGSSISVTLRAFDAFGNEIESLRESRMVDVPTRAGRATLALVGASSLPATADIVVVPGPVATLRILNEPVSRSADQRAPLPLAWEALDVHGNLVAVPASALAWTLVPAGGSVVDGALLQTTRAGTQTLTATHSASGATATLSVRTTPGALAQASLSPAATTIGVGQIKRFVPVFADAHGNALPTPPMAWT